MCYRVLLFECQRKQLSHLMSSSRFRHPIHYASSHRVEQSYALWTREFPELLLIDADGVGEAGIELLERLTGEGWSCSPISLASPEASEALLARGSCVLERPFAQEIFESVVERHLEASAFLAILEPFKLIDFLQLADIGRYSVALRVGLEHQARGLIEIEKGEIWNAYLHDLRGHEALERMLKEPSHQLGYAKLSQAPRQRQIHRSSMGVLLELSRLQDEQRSASGSFSLDPAAYSAEFDEAPMRASLDGFRVAFGPPSET